MRRKDSQRAAVGRYIFHPTAARAQHLCHHSDGAMAESTRDELDPETNRSSTGRGSRKPIVSTVATTTIVQTITQESTTCQSMRGGDADAEARDGMSGMRYRRSHSRGYSRCGRNRRGSHRNYSRSRRGRLRQRATTQVCHNPMRHALLYALRGCPGCKQSQAQRQRQNRSDTSNP